MNTQEVRALLEAADPARGVAIGRGDADAVLQRAAHDITSYEAPGVVRPRRGYAGVAVGTGDADAVLKRAAHDITSYEAPGVVRPRRRYAIAAAALIGAAVVVAVAIAVTAPRPDGTPAPVPAVSPEIGQNCLSALAGRLRPAPYDGVTARYEYQHVRVAAGVTTQVPGKGTFASASWSEDTEIWLAADGSGRQSIGRGAVSYADAASREYFTAHKDALPDAHEERTFAAGQAQLHRLPEADPAAMAEQLYQPRENGPSAALVGAGGLAGARVLDLAHRAALLRFLAGVEGVTCGGTVRTDAGPGLLVTAPVGKGPRPSPGDNGSEALVFDERTGELIARGTGEGHWTHLYLGRDIVN